MRCSGKICLSRTGDSLLTNKRRPILTVVEDTCGVHDTLAAACDLYRYQARCLSGTTALQRLTCWLCTHNIAQKCHIEPAEDIWTSFRPS